jgi:hypothetical protein
VSEEGHGFPADQDSAWRAALLSRSQASERAVFSRRLYAESKWDSASPSGRRTALAAFRYQSVDPASMPEIIGLGVSQFAGPWTIVSIGGNAPRVRAGNLMELTASCLDYLFADRSVRRLGWIARSAGECSLATPSNGTLVQIANVELHCVATALWNLEHQGHIRISEKSGSGRSSLWHQDLSNPEVSLLVERVADADGLVGLEALLLSSLPEAPVDTRGLINSAALGRSLLPIDALLVPVQDEAIAAGAIARDVWKERPSKCLRWSVHSQYRICEDMRASLEAQYEAADQQGLLGRDRPRQFSQLRRECGLALSESRPQQEWRGTGS